jgi:hypothetical protein
MTSTKQAIKNSKGAATRKIVLDALRGATEPVTAREIAEQIKKKRGVSYTTSHIHAVLQLLELQKTVFSEMESPEQTKARGEVAYHYGSRLYWAGGSDMPARTSAVVFPGVDTSALTKAARRAGKLAARSKTKKNVRPGKTMSMQTDSLEVFNLKLRIAELESQLSSIKKILS